MSAGDEDTEKSHEATPHKLLEARRKGDIAKSNDLLTAAGYAGLLLAFLAMGSSGAQRAGTALMVMIDQPDQLAPLFFGSAVTAPMSGLFAPVVTGLLPFFLLPAFAVTAAVFAQRALVFAPGKLKPKLNRISPISNARNKFGRDGLFEFAKSTCKLTIYSVLLGIFIAKKMPDMIATLQNGPQGALALLGELCLSFLLIIVLISAVIGGIDAVWQHASHLRKNRMSHKEVMDEAKNAEGDPHLKQERRQRALTIARTQMMGAVPKADVVIVNPTHYAVALKWSRLPGAAPVCVAKGVDEVAMAIRAAAMESAVPIHSDPPTARALHATVELDQEITPDLYQAVAAAIRFAEAMRQKARARG